MALWSNLISMQIPENVNEPPPTMVLCSKETLKDLERLKNDKDKQTKSGTTKPDDVDNEDNPECDEVVRLEDDTDKEVDCLIRDLLSECDKQLENVEVTTEGVLTKEDLKTDKEKLQKDKESIEKSISEIKGITIAIQAKCDQLIEKVSQSIHKLMNTLEDKKAVMLEEITSSFKIQLDKLCLHKAKLEEGLETAEDLEKKVEKAVDLPESEFLDECVDVKNSLIIAADMMEAINTDHHAIKNTSIPLEFNKVLYVTRKYKLRKMDLLKRSEKTMIDVIKEEMKKKASEKKDETNVELECDTRKTLENLLSFCQTPGTQTKSVSSSVVTGTQGTSNLISSTPVAKLVRTLASTPQVATTTTTQVAPYSLGILNGAMLGSGVSGQSLLLSRQYQRPGMQTLQGTSGTSIQYVTQPVIQNLQVVRQNTGTQQMQIMNAASVAVPTGITQSRLQTGVYNTVPNYQAFQQPTQLMGSNRQFVYMPMTTAQAPRNFSNTATVNTVRQQLAVRPVGTAIRSTFRPQNAVNKITNYTQPPAVKSVIGLNQLKRKLEGPNVAWGPKSKRKMPACRIHLMKYYSNQDYACRDRCNETQMTINRYMRKKMRILDICLDDCTAHPLLEVLNPKQVKLKFNKKMKSCSCTPQPVLAFKDVSFSILGSRPLPIGRCYWEVMVPICGFSVGIATGSVPRNRALGYNVASWCVKYEPTVGMCFVHNSHQNPVTLYNTSIRTIGVLLDRETGVLEFLNAEDKTTLVKVHTKFAAALYPAFSLSGHGCLTVTAGFPYPTDIQGRRKQLFYPVQSPAATASTSQGVK
uniref:Uncharacterized protein LOC100378281 n=1 Tax=Saccoglossus kowalevskii TaxID=10224 RepID=A0ABM0GV69_SACKO|nr:PREDICTED: uncharacterized protein LOC100378281 [Saccoglossus kowalevskii]